MLYNTAIFPNLSFAVNERFRNRRVLAVNRWQIADTKTRVYLIPVVSCGVLWCANLLKDRVIQSRGRTTGYVRDVGVAGSNPVTSTIDFTSIFLMSDLPGSSWGPLWYRAPQCGYPLKFGF